MAIVTVTAASSSTVSGAETVRVSPAQVTASTAATLAGLASVECVRTHTVTASGSSTVSGSASVAVTRIITVTASSSSTAAGNTVSIATRIVALSASSSSVVSGLASAALTRIIPVTSSTASTSSVLASATVTRVVNVTAGSSSLASSSAAVNRAFAVSASTASTISSVAHVNRVFGVTATTAATMHGSADVHRERSLTASAAATMHGASSVSAPNNLTATAAATMHGSASVSVGGHETQSAATMSVTASVEVTLPDGTTIPGGSANAGLQHLLSADVSGDHPFSHAEAADGSVLLANGVGPMLVWNPTAGSVRIAGMLPPTACLLGGSGVGTITGLRAAYVRYLTADGTPTDLSPVSNAVDMGRERLIDGITTEPLTGVITVWSEGHGLTGPETLILRGVQGMEILNGNQSVTPTDADHFTLGIRSLSDSWTQGGSWVWGVASVVYSGVPVSTDTRVARRQILRNLEGSLDTLYVDIDTDDLDSTSFSSTASDESLAAGEPVPLSDPENGLPLANRFAPPPTWKSVVVAHSGRFFAAVDAVVNDGCVLPAPGTNQIAGVGTFWTTDLIGRSLFVTGCPRELTVTDVDADAQVITYTGTMARADTPYALYSIRPRSSERKLVYYSDPGTTDAWPAWNAVQIPEDGDAPVGLYTSGSYLYAVESRHLYRLVFSGVPADNGAVYLSARRGSINHRCVVPAESMIYMLDSAGVHAFDDQTDHPISAPIQTLWHGDEDGGPKLDLAADTALWHGVYDPPRETIRWFVTLVGGTPLADAICYHVRLNAWWLEQYPSGVTSSVTANVDYRRALVGSDVRRVFALWEGSLDTAPDSGDTLRGTATSADSTTLTDTNASFSPNLAGVPVAIVAGTGRGTTGIVSSNTSQALSFVGAMDLDETSVYQIGGVPWHWRSGWFVYSDDTTGNPREFRMSFKPTASEGNIDFAFFYDHSPTPAPMAFANADDGVTTVAGSPYVSASTAVEAYRPGFAMKRMEGHQDPMAYGPSYVSLELSGAQGQDHVAVHHVVIDGASPGIGGDQ